MIVEEVEKRGDALDDLLTINKFGIPPQRLLREAPKKYVKETLQEINNEEENKPETKNERKHDSFYEVDNYGERSKSAKRKYG